MSNKSTRRIFLGQMGIGLWAATRVRRARAASPNEKLNIAMVGCGGQGRTNFNGVRGENIVAFCDVDRAHASPTFEAMPKVPVFSDYRKLLDKVHKDIDAVVVTTPDHMHAIVTLSAMQLGKHVYCEKPLTHTVAEARRVTQATAKYKLVTQMGNGGNARPIARRMVELLRSKAIGDVKEVHIWTDRPSQYWRNGLERPKDTPKIPKTLDWDLWLGVAPERPYHPCYLPAVWRGWYDFGTGALGDMACHHCNVAFWSLDLRDPTAVEAQTSVLHKETYPLWSIIKWEFPKRGDRGPVTLFWYDGGKKPKPELAERKELPANGMIFVGDKGRAYLSGERDREGYHLLPEKDFAGFKPPPRTLPDSPGHHEEWIRNCKSGDLGLDYMSHFGRAGVMTEALLLGNLAVRTGQRIEWDAANLKVTNVPEANQLIAMPYREGWKLPG